MCVKKKFVNNNSVFSDKTARVIDMAEQKIEPKGYRENPVLLPIPSTQRLYGTVTFTWMMFALTANIPLFFLGPIAISFGLSPFEAAFAAFLGNLVAMIVLILNGVPGVRYGIPYPVQLRPSWGFKGSQIAVVLRGIVGAGWYGVEAYNGSLAILMVLLYIFGYAGRDPEAITVASFKYVVVILLPYVAAATFVMFKGLSAIAKVVNYGGPLMLLYFIWLLVYLSQTSAEGAEIPEGVGITSKTFLIYLAIQTNWWATVALNVSDLSRGLYADKRGMNALVIGPIVGVVVGQVVGTLLGYYLVAYVGKVTPQEIILFAAPGAIAIIIGELFAFLAPFSTDVTANIPALLNILTSTLRLNIKWAAIGTGVIGFLLAPWWAVENGPEIVNYVIAFSANYGIILGPIAGIMLADYYIVRKRHYDLQKLYTYGPEGYWYKNGYSISGILSYLITVVVIYLFSWAIGDMPRVGPLVFPTNLSWYLGVVIAFVLHIVLTKVFKEDQA